jgi:hypothetical protein
MKIRFLCFFILLSSSFAYANEEIPDRKAEIERLTKELVEKRAAFNKAKCESECESRKEMQSCISQCVEGLNNKTTNRDYLLSGKDQENGR